VTVPVDELPNGLPLFNVFLHVPAFSARLQLFRLVRSYVIDRFTLHTLLVHPEEVDALPGLAGALGFFQLHGEVWLLRAGEGGVTLGRAGQPAAYRIHPSPGRHRMSIVDSSGGRLDEEDYHAFLLDDTAKVRFLRECFSREYDDAALSVPLIRAYPGRTSLITRTRPFPRLFATDPVGPGTDVHEVWSGPVGVAHA
jgi:hypothetical protein